MSVLQLTSLCGLFRGRYRWGWRMAALVPAAPTPRFSTDRLVEVA